MKDKIVSTSKIFSKPWGEMVDYVNSHPEEMDLANNLAISAFEKNFTSVSLVELFVCLLENNNILFHKKASYQLYQKLAECLHRLIDNDLTVVSPIIKAKACSNIVYADFIFRNKIISDQYERKFLEGISLFESNNDLINERFIAYINISQFYLFKGCYSKTIGYLKKAKALLDAINIPNYHALFWYHYSWVYVETGEYGDAEKRVKSFFRKIAQNSVSPAIYLHGMNIRASIEFRLGNYKRAFIWANKCYKLAVEFYETEEKDVVAENLITIGRYYKMLEKYDETEKVINKAILILEVVFGGVLVDPSQATAHVILGEIYDAQHLYKLAYKEYRFSEKFYRGFYKGNFYKMNEVSIVLANIVIVARKIGDKNLAERYMQKLIKNFPADNCNVQRAKKFFGHAIAKNESL
jgi:tetratricopeptide (TPR) repeat protein